MLVGRKYTWAQKQAAGISTLLTSYYNILSINTLRLITTVVIQTSVGSNIPESTISPPSYLINQLSFPLSIKFILKLHQIKFYRVSKFCISVVVIPTIWHHVAIWKNLNRCHFTPQPGIFVQKDYSATITNKISQTVLLLSQIQTDKFYWNFFLSKYTQRFYKKCWYIKVILSMS